MDHIHIEDNAISKTFAKQASLDNSSRDQLSLLFPPRSQFAKEEEEMVDQDKASEKGVVQHKERATVVSNSDVQLKSVSNSQTSEEKEKGEKEEDRSLDLDFDFPPELPEPPFQLKENLEPKKKDDKPKSTISNGLPEGLLQKMNGAFNTDFSDVKVHQESSSADSMGAQAFAQGSDIHFAPGQYQPESQSGQELIGHELAHTVQQAEGRVKPTKQGKGLPINDDEGLEKEADEKGAAAAQFKLDDSISPGNPLPRAVGKNIDKQAFQLRKETLNSKNHQEHYTVQKKGSSDGKSDYVPSSQNSNETKYEKINRVEFLHKEIFRLQFENAEIISTWEHQLAKFFPVYKRQKITLPEFKKLSNDEEILYGYITPGPDLVSDSILNDYLLGSEIIYKTLKSFEVVTKKRKQSEKVTGQAKEDVHWLNYMLIEGSGANFNKDHLLRILQHSYPYSNERDALFKADTGKDLRKLITIRTKIHEAINKNSFTYVMARAYLDAGKLRPVDKFYIAVTGSGTDEGGVFFAMKQAFQYGIEKMEVEYVLHYSSDDQDNKDSWLPKTGYKKRNWAIAGRLGGDMESGSTNRIKAMCYLSFGEIRPVDKIKLAMHEGKGNEAILNLVREAKEKSSDEDIQAEFTRSWGGSINAFMHSNNADEVAINSKVGTPLSEEQKKRIQELNAKTDKDLTTVLSGKEKTSDRWLELINADSKKKAYDLFLNVEISEKYIILGQISPDLPFFSIDLFRKYQNAISLEDSVAFAILKKYRALSKKSLKSFLRYKANRVEIDTVINGWSNDVNFGAYVKESKFSDTLSPFYKGPKKTLVEAIRAKDLPWARNIIINQLTEDEKSQFVNDRRFRSYFNSNSGRDNELNRIQEGMNPAEVIEAGTDRGFRDQIEGLLKNDFKTRIFAEKNLLNKANSGLGADITNEFSTSGLSAENEQRELEVSLEMAEFDDGKIDQAEARELETGIKHATTTRENFEETRDTVEGAVVMFGSIVLTIVASTFIPGTALLATKLISNALINGTVIVFSNVVIKGDRYSSEHALKDFNRGVLDGIFAVLGPLAVASKFGNKPGITKLILEEIASDAHNVIVDLASGESARQTFENLAKNVVMGMATSGATDASVNLSNKLKNRGDAQKVDDHNPWEDRPDPGLRAKMAHDMSQGNLSGQADIEKFIKTYGGWKNAVDEVRNMPNGKALLNKMEIVRKQVISKHVIEAKELGSSSGGATSDKDINFKGGNAGKNLTKAHDSLTKTYGNYEKMWDTALMVDKSRLGIVNENEVELGARKFKELKRKANRSAEKFILARRLKNAEGNPKELERINKELASRKDDAIIRHLAKQDPEKMQKKVHANHQKVDKLLRQLKNKKLSPSARAKKIEEISLLSQESNFYTKDAYIGSATLDMLEGGVDLKLTSQDVYIVIQDQLSFIDAKVKAFGSVGKATLDYKIFDYQERILRALEIGGVELSPTLKVHKELAHSIAKKDLDENGMQYDDSVLGRDFNKSKIDSRTDEMRANHSNSFLDQIQDEIQKLDNVDLSELQLKEIAATLSGKAVGYKNHNSDSEKEDKHVQKKSKGDSLHSENSNSTSLGDGMPSNIKIHENSSTASSLNALAYTQGSDIHFAPGQFKPNTRSGQELIGHELAHVNQQAEGRVQPTKEEGGFKINDDQHLENEADEYGKSFAAQNSVQTKFSPSVQKKSESNIEPAIPAYSIGPGAPKVKSEKDLPAFKLE